MSYYPPCSRESRPLKAMTAFRFFFHDRRGKVQMEHVRLTGKPITFAVLSERMMNMWDNLDADSKAYYLELQIKDERRYILEHMAWEERLKQEEEAYAAATTTTVSTTTTTTTTGKATY